MRTPPIPHGTCEGWGALLVSGSGTGPRRDFLQARPGSVPSVRLFGGCHRLPTAAPGASRHRHFERPVGRRVRSAPVGSARGEGDPSWKENWAKGHRRWHRTAGIPRLRIFLKRFLGGVQEQPPHSDGQVRVCGIDALEYLGLPGVFQRFLVPCLKHLWIRGDQKDPGGRFYLGKVPAANGILRSHSVWMTEGEGAPQGLEGLPSILVDGCRILSGKDAVALC